MPDIGPDPHEPGDGPGTMPLPSPVVVDITVPGDVSATTPVGVWAGDAAASWVAAPGTPAVTDGPDGAGPQPTGNGVSPPSRTERQGRRRTHRRLLWSIALVAVLVLVSVAWAGAVRINRPLTSPALQVGVSARLTVAGSSPSLPWPAKGQGAIAIPALGYSEQSGPEAPVPIASLTKMTNALVVLRDHPIPAGADGPSITITADDVAEYDTELHNDQSTVAIRVGEVLTERQMLEALLTQSANDIAYSLAVWDAGTLPAFVAKMNALAASLGATSTHYVDASGYDPQSVSTAADCLRIAAVAMQDPTFAQVVGLTSITLPLVGTLPNIVTEIGQNNVVGIKSGYTSAAGGCMVLAADRVVQGRTVLVLAAVLGQPTPPPTVPPTTTTTTTAPRATTTTTPAAAPPATAAPPTTAPPPSTTTTTTPLDDLNVPDPFRYTRPVIDALLNAAQAGVASVPVATKGTAVGTATVVWGGQAHRVQVEAARPAWLLGWPGQEVVAVTALDRVPPGGPRGSRVGTARFSLGNQVQSVPLQLSSTVPEPSWWWRLLHG
jgi:serine-type D-Ala-D-Ala carboxypeptidase (penicillin-binding protein 5/6)